MFYFSSNDKHDTHFFFPDSSITCGNCRGVNDLVSMTNVFVVIIIFLGQ